MAAAISAILFGYIIFYAMAIQEYNNLNMSHRAKMLIAVVVPSLCFVTGGMFIGIESKETDMKRDFRMACNEKSPGVFVCDFNTAPRQN